MNEALSKQLFTNFGTKSIQRSYQFFVDFHIDPINDERFKKDHPKLSKFNNNDRPIEEWHVKNVVLPQHSFKKENQLMGIFPRTFPVYESDGMELRIEMEEDQQNNVALFIAYLQKRIMNEDGVYEHPSKSSINAIEVKILDNNCNIVMKYRYTDCYFLNATEPNYSYSSNEAIAYVLTFGCDTYEMSYS